MKIRRRALHNIAACILIGAILIGCRSQTRPDIVGPPFWVPDVATILAPLSVYRDGRADVGFSVADFDPDQFVKELDRRIEAREYRPDHTPAVPGEVRFAWRGMYGQQTVPTGP